MLFGINVFFFRNLLFAFLRWPAFLFLRLASLFACFLFIYMPSNASGKVIAFLLLIQFYMQCQERLPTAPDNNHLHFYNLRQP